MSAISSASEPDKGTPGAPLEGQPLLAPAPAPDIVEPLKWGPRHGAAPVAPATGIHWPSAVQFGLSLLAIFLLWASAFGLAFSGLAQSVLPASTGAPADVGMLLLAAGLGLSGLLVVPSAGFALLRLIGRRLPELPPLRFRLGWLILLLPLVLLGGQWVSERGGALAWLVLPLLHLLAVSLPVLFLVELGAHRLPIGSPQQRWGVFASGLVLGPGICLVLEILAIAAAFLLVILYVSFQPALARQLSDLVETLRFSRSSPEELARLLGPYLSNPGLIFGVILFASVIVPLIEEAVKPVGVWLLAGRNLTPVEGFTAGLLCGAGYALFESLALSATGVDWGLTVGARAGTAVIHTLNTALVGWALAMAWNRGRYATLGLTYLLAVTIHGLWNGLAILSTFNELLVQQGLAAPYPWMAGLSSATPVGLGVLALAGVFILFNVNRLFRQRVAAGRG